MVSDPTTVNKTASAVNDILKAIIEGAGVTEIVALVVADFPWLGWPVINWVFVWVISSLASYFYKSAANAATKIIVDVQVHMEESSVLNSFQQLQQAIASGDKDAIDLATKDLDNAYGSIIHSDGAAPP